jgi:hypothetical protein
MISEAHQLNVQKYMMEIWQKYDIDGNGTLEKSEFKKFV